MEDNEVFPLVGEDGFARLCAAFYKQVPGDEILGPMYPKEDMEGAEQRLRDYLVYRFGGPRRYEEQRGHPRLRGRHMPFPIDGAARDQGFDGLAGQDARAAVLAHGRRSLSRDGRGRKMQKTPFVLS